jgi:hypothetical protein
MSEGVTQGDPLAMVIYGLAMPPLSHDLRERYPKILQPWYADDTVIEGCPNWAGCSHEVVELLVSGFAESGIWNL